MFITTYKRLYNQLACYIKYVHATPIPPSILEAQIPEMGKQVYEVYGKPQQANCFNQAI
jgi:hypothetical protein